MDSLYYNIMYHNLDSMLLQEHKKQMSEAVENLNAVHEAHKREITQLHSAANQQCKLITCLLGLSI